MLLLMELEFLIFKIKLSYECFENKPRQRNALIKIFWENSTELFEQIYDENLMSCGNYGLNYFLNNILFYLYL